MGSIILCHRKKAREPYEIARIQRRIYTLEELCYYLCNHLYLIDYTIMNTSLCDWLKKELELNELAEELRTHLKQNGSKEQFILKILTYSSIYSAAELKQMQDVLEKLKSQKPVEKQKNKADNLLKEGSYKAAIAIYQSILREDKDDSVDGRFYGRVYGCLGSAYGKMFLYKEAAKMYEAAYQICEDDSMLYAYMYACRKCMSKSEYEDLIRKGQIYRKADEWLRKELVKLEEEIQELSQDDYLSKWKEEYRRIGVGEN